jgi:hypothetical protein
MLCSFCVCSCGEGQQTWVAAPDGPFSRAVWGSRSCLLRHSKIADRESFTSLVSGQQFRGKEQPVQQFLPVNGPLQMQPLQQAAWTPFGPSASMVGLPMQQMAPFPGFGQQMGWQNAHSSARGSGPATTTSSEAKGFREPFLCFGCGLQGHAIKECPNKQKK